MDMKRFAKENKARCEAKNGFNHTIESWSLSDWMTAVTGEVGEAANIIKKLNRHRDGIPGNTKSQKKLKAELALELADVFCYLDLLAQAAGVDLSTVVRLKFDAVSRRIGYNGCPGKGTGWRKAGGHQYMKEGRKTYRRLRVGEIRPKNYQYIATDCDGEWIKGTCGGVLTARDFVGGDFRVLVK